MTQEQISKATKSIRDQARIVQMHAESSNPTNIMVHNLWRETGKLHSMVNALKSEIAGNDEPKIG